MSSLQNKFNNYEVSPPAQVWDKVAAALDESLLDHDFPSKLYEIQAAPPASAWSNINASLSQPGNTHMEEAKVVPMRKRATTFIRYAAAVLLIGVVAAGVLKWTTGSSVPTQEGIVNARQPDQKDAEQATRPASTERSQNVAKSDQPQIAQLSTATNSITTRTIGRKSQAQPQTVEAGFAFDDTFIDTYNNPIYAYDNIVPSISDRYIMLMTPDGNFIRMSKKLGNLVCCVSGEEQDEDCKSQLKKWQEKIADSPIATSSGNFLDILSLVGSLEEL